MVWIFSDHPVDRRGSDRDLNIFSDIWIFSWIRIWIQIVFSEIRYEYKMALSIEIGYPIGNLDSQFG